MVDEAVDFDTFLFPLRHLTRGKTPFEQCHRGDATIYLSRKTNENLSYQKCSLAGSTERGARMKQPLRTLLCPFLEKHHHKVNQPYSDTTINTNHNYMNLKNGAERVSLSTTLDVYSHVLPSLQEDVKKRWDDDFVAGVPVPAK